MYISGYWQSLTSTSPHKHEHIDLQMQSLASSIIHMPISGTVVNEVGLFYDPRHIGP